MLGIKRDVPQVGLYTRSVQDNSYVMLSHACDDSVQNRFLKELMDVRNRKARRNPVVLKPVR